MLAIAAGVAVWSLGVPATAYTSADVGRDATADVVADEKGALGLNTSGSVATGQVSDLFTLTNRLGATANVTVTLASGSTGAGDLVVGGTDEGDEATFDLLQGNSQTVEFDTACDDSLVGTDVTYTVNASTGGVEGVATRSANVTDGGCTQMGVVFVTKSTQNTSTIDRTGKDPTSHLDHKVAEIGPARTSLDGDSATEIPYVYNNDLVVIGFGESSSVTLDSSQSVNAEPVGIGDYDGDGADEVYYNRKKNLYSVRGGESPTKVVDASNFTNSAGYELAAVAGVADFDGDGAVEVVYSNSNRDVAYVEQDGTLVQTGYANLGSTHAIGRPADLDGDGELRVPVVTGSGYVALVNSTGDATVLNSTYSASAADSLAVHDVDGDGSLEVVFADANERLHYMELDGTHGTVDDAGGSAVSANKNKGAG